MTAAARLPPVRSALPAALSALAMIVAGSGCYNPGPESGSLLCGPYGQCPSGYHCARDYTCWRDGSDPSQDASAALPPDFSEVPDLWSPLDAPPADMTRLPDLLPPPDLRPAALGVLCRLDGECASGFCVDGVCCAVRACPDRCTSCAAGKGAACAPVAAGVVDPRGICSDDARACRRGSCDGKGGCQPALAGTPCAPSSCANGQLTAARTCNGLVLGCPAAAPATACPGRLVCADGADCLRQCQQNGDCTAGSCCRAGTCFDNKLAASCGASCLDCSASASGHACIAGACGCNADIDCAGIPSRPRCDAQKKTCVACATSFDCTPVAPLCSAGSCVACGRNLDCANSGWGASCLGGACVCTQSADCNDAGNRARRCDNMGRCVCGQTGAPCPVGRFCSDGTINGTCL